MFKKNFHEKYPMCQRWLYSSGKQSIILHIIQNNYFPFVKILHLWQFHRLENYIISVGQYTKIDYQFCQTGFNNTYNYK